MQRSAPSAPGYLLGLETHMRARAGVAHCLGSARCSGLLECAARAARAARALPRTVATVGVRALQGCVNIPRIACLYADAWLEGGNDVEGCCFRCL